MMKTRNCVIFGVLLFYVLGCRMPQGSIDPYTDRSTIAPKISRIDTSVETVLYVDTEKENPLNAMDYVLNGEGDIQFFDYVVIGYAYPVKRSGQKFADVEMTSSLKYILDNASTFILPLQKKGIKVLVELRSGPYADDPSAEGNGLGLATMDETAYIEFAKVLTGFRNHYGFNGFDFNDIGGGKSAYPPQTQFLKASDGITPLYHPNSFINPDSSPMSPAQIEEKLWIDGGNNFSSLIEMTNRRMLVEYQTSFSFKDHTGADLPWRDEDPMSVDGSDLYTIARIRRTHLVRTNGHGDKGLHFEINPEGKLHPPILFPGGGSGDPEYPGMDITTIPVSGGQGNVAFIANDRPYDNTRPHPYLYYYVTKNDEGLSGRYDTEYAPFAIDLQDRRFDIEVFADTFLYNDNANSSNSLLWDNKGTSDPSDDVPLPFNPSEQDMQYKYGAVAFTNLRPISEDNLQLDYLNSFCKALWGPNAAVTLSGRADYKR